MSNSTVTLHASGLALYGYDPEIPTKRIYLHGLGNSSAFWDQFISEFDHGQVVAADLPGFGQSAAAGNLDQSLTQLRMLVQDLQPKQVIAHSLGGLFALGALSDTQLDTELVLVGAHLWRAIALLQQPTTLISEPMLAISLAAQYAGGVLPFPRLQSRALESSNFLRRLVLWPFVSDPGAQDPSRVAAAIAGNGGCRAILSATRGVTAYALDEIAAGLETPVWIIRGEHDRLLSSADDDYALALLPDLRGIEVLPGVGHWPMIENPQALANALDRTLPR